MAIAPKPWEEIFEDIIGGSRAESRRQRGMPDDQLDDWRAPAMEAASRAGEGIENDIVDAELVEPGPDRNELPSSNAEQGDGVGRRTYTLSDFNRP